jgi:hypothetical protein
VHAFTAALLAGAAALPGVESVTVAGNHPLDPGFTNSFVVVGREAESEEWPEILVRCEPVFPRSRSPGAEDSLLGANRTVVGIVANEKFQGLEAAEPFAVYVPLAQAPSANGAGVLLVRAAGGLSGAASEVRGVFRGIDPALALFGIEPLERTVSNSLGKRRFIMLLVALFAGVALLLAIVGIHGVLSYDVMQQRREIGIRIALGAGRHDIVGRVVGRGLVPAVSGILIGTAVAMALRRVLANLLFDISPEDPATLVTVGVSLLAAAVAASYVPARRAAVVDPMVVLRSE